MRLTPSQIDSIRIAARKVLGQQVSVRLFGSRVRDDIKGGDIDLFFETPDAIDNRALAICRIQGALLSALGDRKVNILLKDARTPRRGYSKSPRKRGIAVSLAFLPTKDEFFCANRKP